MQDGQQNKIAGAQYARKKRCQGDPTADITQRSPAVANSISSMTPPPKTPGHPTDSTQTQNLAKKMVSKHCSVENSKTQDDQPNKIISATCTRKKRLQSSSADTTRRNLCPTNGNNISLTTSALRTSVHLTDSAQSQNLLAKKRHSMVQTTLLPRQPQPDGPKKLGLKSSDTDSMLLYNGYLQAIVEQHIIKKKAEERRNVIITQLATIAKESDRDMAELAKHRIREKDVINLTIIQNELDPLIADVNQYITDESNKTVMDILSRLYSVVKPLDVLHCENVILPESPEEGEELQTALKKCSATLGLIVDLIGSKGEVYKAVHDGLNDFIKVNNNIQALQKRLEGLLCNLQSLALKDAATALMQSGS